MDSDSKKNFQDTFVTPMGNNAASPSAPAIAENPSAEEASALDEIAQAELPEAIATPLPAIPVGLLIALGFFSLTAGQVMPDYRDLANPVGIGSIVFGIIWLSLAMVWRKSHLTAQRDAVDSSLQELGEIQSATAEFLNALDKRTARYFHCVTNTKITSYFILRQIETGLNQLLTDVRALVDNGSPECIIEALERLRSPFTYRDGFDFNSGHQYEVPIDRLPQLIMKYRQELTEGIESLEREIRIDATSSMDDEADTY